MIDAGRVRVLRDEIARRWVDGRTSMGLSFVPDRPLEPADALAACAGGVFLADEAHKPSDSWDEDYASSKTIAPSEGLQDVEISLEYAPTAERALAWIDTVANQIQVAGFSGNLGPAIDGYLPARSPLHPSPVLTAVMFLTGWFTYPPEEQRGRGTYPYPVWIRDPGAAVRIADWAVDWLAQPIPDTPPTEPYPSGGNTNSARTHGLRATLNVTTFLIPPAMAKPRLARQMTDAWIEYDPDNGRGRHVHFDRCGRIAAQTYDTTQPWTTSLADLSSLLTDHAAELELGIIRRSGHRSGDIAAALVDNAPRPPHAREVGAYYTYARRLDASRVPDAYGIQILTSQHLANANDLSAWSVTDLGGDRHLVEHPDPGTWYAQDQPDPDVLEQARHDFGAMINDQRQ